VDDLQIRLLGGFRVTVGGRDVPDTDWHLRKAKTLVKLLALTPGHRLHRDQLMDLLWPELDVDAAANQLRKALHEARRVLDPDPAVTFRYITSGEQLTLKRSCTWVDVEAFERAALEARRVREPSAYDDAIAVYGGDLLPEDRYEDWAMQQATVLRDEFLALLLELARLLEARAELDRAAAALRRVISADSVHEEAYVGLMRLHALAGRRHEALRVYDRLCSELSRELDGEPDVTTQRLHEQIKAGRALEPDLSADLWEQVGDLRMMSGDASGAATAYASALAALHGSPAKLRSAVLNRKAAQAHLMQHDTARGHTYLAAAEELLSDGADEAEAARLLSVRANWLCEVGRYEEAQRAAEASLRAAETTGTPDDVAVANETLAIVYHFRGAWREGLHVEIDRLGSSLDNEPQLARIFEIHCCIGQYHLYGDGLCDSVEAYAHRTLELASARNARRAEAFAWCLLGESQLLQGRWDEAHGCLSRSTEIYAEFGAGSGVLPWQRMAELAAGRGDRNAVARCLRRGMAIAAITPLASHAWGRLYATQAFDAVESGDPAGAAHAVRASAEAATRYGSCPSCAALLNPVAAEAFAALGDVESAVAHARAAEQVASMFASSAWGAMAESARGSQAVAEGDAGAARARFLSAAELYDRARQPFWEARSKLQAASAGGGGSTDGDLAREAAATFERLGAQPALTRARQTAQP